MKKSELWTRIALVVIVAAALFAIVLQILNEKTNTLETAYEIITFGVALLAVILAVLQGLDNARTTRELHRIAREMSVSLEEIRDVNRDNDRILKEMRGVDRDSDSLRAIVTEDERLDKASLQILEKHAPKNPPK